MAETKNAEAAVGMRTAARELQVHTVCQMILVAIAAGAALYFLRSVFLPFILAVFFVTGVAPVLHWIERSLHAPRMVAVAIAFLLGILLFTVLWLLIWLSVASLMNNAETYRERIVQLVGYVEEWMPGGQGATLPPAASAEAERALPGPEVPADGGDGPASVSSPASVGDGGEFSNALTADPAVENPPAKVPPAATPGDRLPAGYDFSAFLTQHVGNIMGHLSTALMDLLSSAMMVLIFMFFLLLGDPAAAARRHGVWNEIQAGIRSYIVTKTLISVVTGGFFGLVLWLFGIPLALVFGLLAFLLNFIPNIGPIIASLLPLPLILLHPDLSILSMVLVIVLTTAVQFISGNVIEPKVMGDSFQLHPVVILLTLMFWGMLWGIVGMFLATPITAALKVFLEEFEHTRPIARWLEGRFDGSPRSSAGSDQAMKIGDAPAD